MLQLLIRHVRYRDSYASSEFKDSQTIHGPYWLNAITPESFSPVSAADAETLIRTWAEYSVPLTDGDREAMEREVYPPDPGREQLLPVGRLTRNRRTRMGLVGRLKHRLL